MKNVGTADRVVRVILGLVVLSLFFILNRELRYIGLIGLIPLITGLTGFCPMYAALRMKTRERQM
jgi:hypothetical protein